MQKIIIDTNVPVSALIQRSYPYLLFYTLFVDNKFELCLSEELIREYQTVLLRPKFAKYQDFNLNAKAILVDIETKATFFVPTIKLSIINDLSDNMILELADESDANFIVTGNTNDFTFSSYKQTKIVSPKEYWDNYKAD